MLYLLPWLQLEADGKIFNLSPLRNRFENQNLSLLQEADPRQCKEVSTLHCGYRVNSTGLLSLAGSPNTKKQLHDPARI